MKYFLLRINRPKNICQNCSDYRIFIFKCHVKTRRKYTHVYEFGFRLAPHYHMRHTLEEEDKYKRKERKFAQTFMCYSFSCFIVYTRIRLFFYFCFLLLYSLSYNTKQTCKLANSHFIYMYIYIYLTARFFIVTPILNVKFA